jgi:hypothetical protein
MRLLVSDTVNAKEWNAKVISFHGSVFHSSFWADYIAACNPGTVPKFFSMSLDNGDPLGLALGFEGSSLNRLLSPITKCLWFDALPAAINGGNEPYEFIKLLDRHAQSLGYLKLQIGSYASYDAMSDLETLGFDLTKRLEFEFFLDSPLEELWSKIGNKRRNIIKRAENEGVTIHELPGKEGLLELRRLKEETNHRILLRGGPDLATKFTPACDPLSKLVESGIGRILVAKFNEEVISAGLFTCFNTLAYFMIAAHSARGLQMQAPSLLVWESIKRFRQEGWKRFSLGGCKISAMDEDSPEHGVYLFKKRFKAKILPCASGLKYFHKKRQKILEIFRHLKSIAR